MPKVMITGANGFVGQHLVKEFRENLSYEVIPLSSKDADLRIKTDVLRLMLDYHPDIVVHLAATCGGIGANMDRPGTFFYDNITMGVNLIHCAKVAKCVKKFVQLGSVCAYPKFTSVPFIEEDLWNGYPEETNAPYGIAKKALLVMLQAYRQQYNFNGIYLLPVNLYGPGDNFDERTSHVIPALIRKVHHAVENNLSMIEIWGSGDASREFLYVKDCAKAILIATEKYNKADPINIGSGNEITIRHLVEKICLLMEYKGKIIYNKDMPDGQPRRRLDTSKAFKEFGFESTTNLNTGLKETIQYWVRTQK